MTRVPLADIASQEAMVAAEALGAIERVARRGHFILGPEVAAFEEWLARKCGVSHAVGVASGTDALVLTLRALGVGAGDAVITPALSFIAAAEAIAAVGARPVFCDVDPLTMNASADTVDCAIVRARRDGLRIRGLLPVHLFGRCAPLAVLRELGSRAGAFLIEDAAQAIGAHDESGNPAGGGGDAGCFSFFPTKNLGAWGDGGAVVTPSKEVAAKIRQLRAHGAVAPYVHAEVGYNSRLDTLQAAVLLTKTPRLDAWQSARRRAAARYAQAFAGLPMILPGPPEPPALHAWHAYVVRCDRRDALAHSLRENGVDTRVYYPVPLHRQTCFASGDSPRLPVAEAICDSALALPIFATMTEAQQEQVVAATSAFFR